jgi:hypothetical protein
MPLKNYIISKIRSKMKSMKNKARDEKRRGKFWHTMDDPKAGDENAKMRPSLDVHSFPSQKGVYSKRVYAGSKTSDRFRKEGTYFDKAGTRKQTERSNIDRRKPSKGKMLADTALKTTGVAVPAAAIGVMAKQYNEKVKKAAATKKANRKTKLTKDSVPLTKREIERRFQGKYKEKDE